MQSLFNYLLIAVGVFIGYTCTTVRRKIHLGFHPWTALYLALTWPLTVIYHLFGF